MGYSFPISQLTNCTSFMPAAAATVPTVSALSLTKGCSEKALLGVEIAHPALDHLIEDRFRLALFAGGFSENLPFLLHLGRIEIGRRDDRRPRGHNVHADVLCQRGVDRAADLQENTLRPVVVNIAVQGPSIRTIRTTRNTSRIWLRGWSS